jgi:hypothetical protein
VDESRREGTNTRLSTAWRDNLPPAVEHVHATELLLNLEEQGAAVEKGAKRREGAFQHAFLERISVEAREHGALD